MSLERKIINYLKKTCEKLKKSQQFHVDLYKKEPTMKNEYKLHYFDGQLDALLELSQFLTKELGDINELL